MWVLLVARGRLYTHFSYLLISLLVIVSGLTSCSMPSRNPQTAPAQSSMNVLVAPSTLTVGSDVMYFPQEYRDPHTQQATGFDIDVANALAQHLHLRAQIKQDKFQNLIEDLQDKRFDIVISAMGITPELQNEVSYIPYFVGGESLLVRKGNPAHISALSNLCGLPVAVKRNTVEEQEIQTTNTTCRKNGQAALTMYITDKGSEAVQLLQTGRVAAVYEDIAQMDYAIKQQPGLFQHGGAVIDPILEGIIVRKEDNLTLNALQKAFQQILVDGTYRSLINKWGLYSSNISSRSIITNQR